MESDFTYSFRRRTWFRFDELKQQRSAGDERERSTISIIDDDRNRGRREWKRDFSASVSQDSYGKRTFGLLIFFIVEQGGGEQLETTTNTLEEKDKGESTAAPSWTNRRRKEEGRKCQSYTANEKGTINDKWLQ